MFFDSPTQKFGYLDIKQSSKVKGRKLKTWRRRWIVLTKMTNMSNEEFVAKLDLYTSENSWKNHDSDKTTFMLENISCIQSAKSKTHPNAFEIVDRHPILVLSGSSDLESYSWMLTLQQILTPELIDAKKDSYSVKALSDGSSQKWNISGELTLGVSPACISLVNTERTCVVSWGLSTLVRFNVEKNPSTGLMNILMIECGPNSPTGQSSFRFQSDEAQEILSAIRQSICIALAQKQIARRTCNTRPRAVSVTVSEKGFQHLLDSNPVVIDPSRDRSESDSSNSITGTSPTMSVSPASVKQELTSSGSFHSWQQGARLVDQGVTVVRSGSELEALVESDEHGSQDSKDYPDFGSKKPASREPSKEGGYTVIRDVNSADQSGLGASSPASSPPTTHGDEDKKVSITVGSSEALHLAWSKSDRPASYETTPEKTLPNQHVSIRTMTLPLMHDDRQAQPLYQEIDRVGSTDPSHQKEGLSKKRSSSTGDLQLMKKRYEPTFEDDYEELDELRASVQKLHIGNAGDSPPALPARPSSKSFVQNKLNSSMGLEMKKKRPFFKRSEKPVTSSNEEVSRKQTNNSGPCSCGDIGANRQCFVSDNGHCIICKGTVEIQKPKRNVRSSSKDDLLASTHSSLNDLYMSIPEVSTNLTKRRRSSDITPVSSSFYASCEVSVQDLQKLATSIQKANEPDTHETVNNPNIIDAAAPKTPSPKPNLSKSSDPLISFFVDDENFLSHPMVVSQMSTSVTTPTTPTNSELLNSGLLATNSPTSPVPVFPFFGLHFSVPPTCTPYSPTSDQGQISLSFWPQASNLQMSPTMTTTFQSTAGLWNSALYNGLQARPISTTVAHQEGSYITMAGNNLLRSTESSLAGDEINGGYVGPTRVDIMALLAYVAQKDTEQVWKGYVLAGAYFVVQLIVSLGSNQALLALRRLGMRVKASLISAIYKKSLTITNINDETTAGEIVNLMSVDSQKIEDVCNYLYFVVSTPFQLALSIYMLYDQLGVAVFAGLGVMALAIPFNGVIGYFLRTYQMQQMKLKDKRMKLMSEVLSGIKVLKLYAWEGSFEQKVEEIRREELKIIKKFSCVIAALIFMFNTMPYMVQLTSFGVYIALSDQGHLGPSTAFVSLQLFNMMNAPLTFFHTDTSCLGPGVAVTRLARYLNTDDIKPDVITRDPTAANAVEIVDGVFTWDKEQITPTLRDINISIKPGSLVAVVGTVGCGKSSLLSAILGEMEKLKGSVTVKSSTAYVPQEAWIQNATLRDNILFGSDLQRRRYDKVIEACALKTDLEILPGGDATEIGEKGINISGGQKQRVSLARAVYSNNDIYLLDDPLSAVDSHVGKHIFQKVIGHSGFLKDKTRILVTHGVHWLPSVDSIIVMTNGTISEMGTYEQLLEKNGAFAQFLKEYIQKDMNSDTEMNTDPEIEAMKRSVLQRVESITGRIVESATSADEKEKSGLSGSARHRGNRGNRTQSESKRSRRRDNSIMESASHVLSDMESSLALHKSIPSTHAVGEKLIEAEVSATGKIKLAIYMYYFRAIGLPFFILALVVYMLYSAASVFSGIWLSMWTDDDLLVNTSRSSEPEYTDRENVYLGVYGASGIGQGVLILIFAIIAAIKMTEAARRLHQSLLENVMRSPMSFFDTTPLGRIVNRFSRDVEVIDNALPGTMKQSLNCIGRVLTTIVTISYGTPIFLSVMVPLSFIYILIQIGNK
ncbi:Canalicular multispecific organic anion transporter 1 [Bulinus truncatus]|nr:Canalicular multispecific organic anion transporter 1 [Bulinus truncatus]